MSTKWYFESDRWNLFTDNHQYIGTSRQFDEETHPREEFIGYVEETKTGSIDAACWYWSYSGDLEENNLKFPKGHIDEAKAWVEERCVVERLCGEKR